MSSPLNTPRLSRGPTRTATIDASARVVHEIVDSDDPGRREPVAYVTAGHGHASESEALANTFVRAPQVQLAAMNVCLQATRFLATRKGEGFLERALEELRAVLTDAWTDGDDLPLGVLLDCDGDWSLHSSLESARLMASAFLALPATLTKIDEGDGLTITAQTADNVYELVDVADGPHHWHEVVSALPGSNETAE